MSFDAGAIRASVAAHGAVVRVLLVAHRGSTPREDGASMLIDATGQEGTIGGGALEWQATAAAQALLEASNPATRVERMALGPALGQCCGGSATLLLERFDAARLAAAETRVDAPAGHLLRPVTADAGAEPPLALRRAAGLARSGRQRAPVMLAGGWLLEPITRPRHALWVWGAGHVGRAVVAVAAPLPDLAIAWVDTAAERFPQALPQRVKRLIAAQPGTVVALAPTDAQHLVMTYSHAIDLDLCHRLLGHGFAGLGLIGSETKWARFSARLRGLGHAPAHIARIRCPLGEPALGKHPQAVAVGAVAEVMRLATTGAEQAKPAYGEQG